LEKKFYGGVAIGTLGIHVDFHDAKLKSELPDHLAYLYWEFWEWVEGL